MLTAPPAPGAASDDLESCRKPHYLWGGMSSKYKIWPELSPVLRHSAPLDVLLFLPISHPSGAGSVPVGPSSPILDPPNFVLTGTPLKRKVVGRFDGRRVSPNIYASSCGRGIQPRWLTVGGSTISDGIIFTLWALNFYKTISGKTRKQ